MPLTPSGLRLPGAPRAICAVAGMPGAALREGLAGRVANPAEIGRLLMELDFRRASVCR